ncbi:MAG: 30S ribosomal protein S20 [Anaerolineales bacterium]
MANIKSQIKRMRQNEKRRLRNRMIRGQARAALKRALEAIESGQITDALIRQAVRALDKAAEKGVLHKNNVARRKSRLMKRLAAARAAQQSASA